MIIIETYDDAKNFVENSGVFDWSFGGEASAEGFTQWIYQNCHSLDPTRYDKELGEYLISIGEDPNEYGLSTNY